MKSSYGDSMSGYKVSRETLMKLRAAQRDRALLLRKNRPHLGEIRQTGEYYAIRVGDDQKLLHRYVWELYNGPIPKGYDVHHVNGNPKCNCICNLIMVTRKEHYWIHRREHWLEEINNHVPNMS